KRLGNYEWPKPQQVRPEFPGVVLKWAAAAAILILGIGFGLGRLSEPSAAQLRQSIASEVKKQVQNELKTDLLAAFAAHDPAGTDGFQQQLRRELISTLSSNQTSSQKQLLLQEILKA